MKVIYRKRNYTLAEAEKVVDTTFVRIQKSLTGLDISVKNAGGNGSVLSIAEDSYPENTMTHVFWSTAAQGFIQRQDATRWRDMQSHLWFNDGARYGIALVITRFQGETYIDISGLPTCIDEGVDKVFDVIGRSPIRAIANINAAIEDAPFIKDIRARAEMMRDINPIDILSDLEKQIDILTVLVIKLASGEPMPDWFKTFADHHPNITSNQFKGDAWVVHDIIGTKQKLRELQKKFFQDRK